MATEAQDPRLKQLRIMVGVVKRLDKELVSYQKEAEKETAKLEKMKSENRPPPDLKYQEKIILESVNLLPDIQRKLEEAYSNLKNLVEESNDLNETDLYQSAHQVLKEIKI